MPEAQKDHYEKYDFINPAEQVRIGLGHNDAATLEHNHEFYEMIVVTHGTGTHTINGDVFQVMAGDIFLLTPQDYHSFIPRDKKEEFQWIDFIWLPHFYEIKDSTLLQFKKYRDEESFSITNMIMDMLFEFNRKQQDYLEIIKHQLYVITKKLRRLVQLDDRSYAERHCQNLVKRAVSYINNNYQNPITLNDISDHLSISQVYLCKLFKAEMGVGAIQYLRKIRVDHAVHLLISTQMQIAQISEAVGFSDVKSFFTSFKNQFGVTPNNYRKHFLSHINSSAEESESPDLNVSI